MKYKFDVEIVIRCEVEVEADSGDIADQTLETTKLDELINNNKILEENRKINFVDLGFTDLVSGKEWKSFWKNNA